MQYIATVEIDAQPIGEVHRGNRAEGREKGRARVIVGDQPIEKDLCLITVNLLHTVGGGEARRQGGDPLR